MTEALRKPWLVAVWPGMGGVAQIAGSYLVQKLGGVRIAEVSPSTFFQPTSIVVKHGLVQSAELPRSNFFACRVPEGERDLVVMLAERQPPESSSRYAAALLDVAAHYGIERVFTFAAMATPIHPAAEPRVFGASTQANLLEGLRESGVTLLEDGEITGLNGLFVSIAGARDLPSVCLLGEFPFFAMAAPNPRASAAVLRVFSGLAGVPLDLEGLEQDAKRVERNLLVHLEKLQEASAASGAEEEEQESWKSVETKAHPGPSREILERIEKLFDEARMDRSKALELKNELDRRGLFRQYEDRFLDLFKQAG